MINPFIDEALLGIFLDTLSLSPIILEIKPRQALFSVYLFLSLNQWSDVIINKEFFVFQDIS